MRGKAVASGPGLTTDVEAALVSPRLARVEITGPLGIHLALLQLNSEWAMLYIPRENLVYRFPSNELERDTLRRTRFLSLLPLPLAPEVFVDAVLTRVNLPSELRADRLAPEQCGYDPSEVAYRVRVPNPAPTPGGRWVWIDPASYAPLKILYFDRALPLLLSSHDRASAEARFSKFSGEGAATLPRRIEINAGPKRNLRFEWTDATVWAQPDPRVFEWRPAASVQVRDY
jgi:hypothetical protein